MSGGLLIVLEGIDGSGKSTLARNIEAALQAKGYQTILTREPTDGPHGAKIRALAERGERDGITPQEEFQLFHEDRKEHVAKVVQPALASGAVVIQDRSYFSTVAYQSLRGLDGAWILKESESVAPKPDVLLVVDVPVETALERISKSRGTPRDDFERADALRKIRETFLGFEGAVVIDGLGAIKTVEEHALRAILPKLWGEHQ